LGIFYSFQLNPRTRTVVIAEIGNPKFPLLLQHRHVCEGTLKYKGNEMKTRR
jgi:hypothetical protein